MSVLPSNILYKTSTIDDGNMSFRFDDNNVVTKNKNHFLKKNGIDFPNHVCMACNHGDSITTVTRDTPGVAATSPEEMLESEVLVTQEKGLALMLLTADCLPVSFYDPVTQTIALAHISRHTLTLNLPQKTVGFLREVYGTDPSNLLINIGPHIKKESYKFSLPLEKNFPALTPFIEEKGGYAYIDALECCIQQLTQLGISLENISVSKIDTATSPEHFSHYRSKQKSIINGRLATILMLS